MIGAFKVPFPSLWEGVEDVFECTILQQQHRSIFPYKFRNSCFVVLDILGDCYGCGREKFSVYIFVKYRLANIFIRPIPKQTSIKMFAYTQGKRDGDPKNKFQVMGEFGCVILLP